MVVQDDGTKKRARSLWRARWFLPTATVVLGLILGMGMGGSSADSVNTASETKATPTVTVTEKADPAPTVTKTLDPTADQVAALTAREQSVAALESQMAARETAVAAAEVRIKEGTIPGDGTYLVGSQVQPGRYQSQGGDPCFWARLDGNGGTIDNYIGNGAAVVTVRSSDAAINTSRCEDFIKVG